MMDHKNIFCMDVKQFRHALQAEYDDSALFRAQMHGQPQEAIEALRMEHDAKSAEAGRALETATRAFAESLAAQHPEAIAMPNVRIGPFEFDWIVASETKRKEGSRLAGEELLGAEPQGWVVHHIVECKVRVDDVGRSFLRFQHSLRWLKGEVQHARVGYFSCQDGFSPSSFARFVPSEQCKQRFGRDFIVDGLHFVTQAAPLSALGNSRDRGKTRFAALNLQCAPARASHAMIARVLKFARKLQRATTLDGEPCAQYLIERKIVCPNVMNCEWTTPQQ